MLVTGREAIRILRPVVSGDAQARWVLRSGLAGPGTPTDRGPMYDESDVRRLVGRPFVDVSRLELPCPHGLYIARLARAVEVDVSVAWPELAARLGPRPPMPAWTAALLAVRMSAWGTLPWIATLCGWVVFGADARGFREDDEHGVSFDLDPPGVWFRALDRRRLPTSPGGRPWYLWTPPLG